jgi:hypothetical protein
MAYYQLPMRREVFSWGKRKPEKQKYSRTPG